MRSKAPILIFLLLIVSLVELYAYSGVSHLLAPISNNGIYWSIYGMLFALSIYSVVFMVNNFDKDIPGMIRKSRDNFISGLALTLLLTKLSFVVVMITEDLYRSGLYAFQYAAMAMSSVSSEPHFVQRSDLFAQFGLGFASIPLVSFIYGITVGKYNYKVKRVRLEFQDLPKAFDGYRIVQFSDMHSGSFDSLKNVQKGIDKMNEEEADLILFTGDMVNNHSSEVKPFIPMLKSLKAKDGKYSILGNHDYGDYIKWASKEDKIHNLYQLIHHQEDAGFKLLLNENVSIKRNGEQIRLLGVENWGKPPFSQHGDLSKALLGVEKGEFTILMSHDPSHWEYKVLEEDHKIHLTMSGHTHGMQFGLDIAGLKWSPVKYKYPRWSGLYEELGRFLYVNNGFGFLGFPGRVGIYPEITVFELVPSS